MALTPSRAIPYAEALGVLADFPNSDAAVREIAKIIAKLCEDEAEAGALVDRMLADFNKWPGPMALRTVHREMYPPPERTYRPEWEGQPRPVYCSKCVGGMYEHEKFRFSRCTCVDGATVTDEDLERLNRMYENNRMQVNGKPAKPKLGKDEIELDASDEDPGDDPEGTIQ